MKINIRESLGNIDKENYGKYNLLSLYESVRLSEKEKEEIASLLLKDEDAEVIYNLLVDKLGKDLSGLKDEVDDLYFKESFALGENEFPLKYKNFTFTDYTTSKYDDTTGNYYNEGEVTKDFTYRANKKDVIEEVCNLLYNDDEEFNKLNIKDPNTSEFDKYVEDNLEMLVNRYNKQVLDKFENEAREVAEDQYSNHQFDWYNLDESNEEKKIIKEDNNKPITKDQLKKIVLDNGYIPIDNRKDNLYYVVAKINDDNFGDIPPKLKEQLKDEGLYNRAYIGFMSYSAKPPYTVQMLPIYGDSKRYVTKWFTSNPGAAIDHDLSERYMKLLKRANEYILESNIVEKIIREDNKKQYTIESMNSKFSDTKMEKLRKIIIANGKINNVTLNYVIEGSLTAWYSPSKNEIGVMDPMWGYPRYIFDGKKFYKKNVGGKTAPLTSTTLINNVLKLIHYGKYPTLDMYDDEGNIIETIKEDIDHINKYAIKFKIGDRVKFIHPGNELSPETATIIGYDEDGFYKVRWEDSTISTGIGDPNLVLVEYGSDDIFENYAENNMKIIKEDLSEVTYHGKRYKVKSKEFLNGKLAGYNNENGLERLGTVKMSDGNSYTIYDSGFGNMRSSNACAVKVENIKEDVMNSQEIDNDEDDLIIEPEFVDEDEENETFIEDGNEYEWDETFDSIYIDFDHWEIRSAVNVDTDELVYFIVEADTDFIDWGPLDTIEEAREFLESKETDEIDESLDEKNYKTEYMLLSRLKSDCEYYLGFGNRSNARLWAGNVKAQIAKMKELYNMLPVKPIWLTIEDIDNYEKEMTNSAE